MNRTVTLTLMADLPNGVSAEEFRDYVETEVRSGTGHRMPDDPMWHLDRSSVVVKISRARIPA